MKNKKLFIPSSKIPVLINKKSQYDRDEVIQNLIRSYHKSYIPKKLINIKGNHFQVEFNKFILGAFIECFIEKDNKIIGFHMVKYRKNKIYTFDELLNKQCDLDQLACSYIILKQLGFDVDQFEISIVQILQTDSTACKTHISGLFLYKRWRRIKKKLDIIVDDIYDNIKN